MQNHNQLICLSLNQSILLFPTPKVCQEPLFLKLFPMQILLRRIFKRCCLNLHTLLLKIILKHQKQKYSIYHQAVFLLLSTSIISFFLLNFLTCHRKGVNFSTKMRISRLESYGLGHGLDMEGMKGFATKLFIIF